MFRTELPFAPHPQQLPLSARVLTIGSCFSDVIGARLTNARVQTLPNPFGTVFNPLSACKLLRAAAGEETDWQQHLVEARGRWQSYDLHANIGAESPVALLQQIQELAQQTGDFLRTADVVVLTLGSAFAYRLLETQELVSNCHKVPAERFEKELLTPDEIINAIAETHAFLRQRNPRLRFVLTVSPVRHLKDTLPLNAVSKSVLRVACHYLSELLADVSYFPAYELLLDDLRDYRFYAADMLHPSEVAEEYIWERFARTYFDAEFGRFRKEWESVRQALAHRPLYPAAPEHRQFLENTLARLQRLASQTDLRPEIREVERQLRALPVPKPVVVPEPEEDEEERVDIGPEAEANQLPASSAPVPLTADAPEADDEEAEDPQEEVPTEAPAGSTKKKRRSRGGAKRNARKKAAQLAALNVSVPEAPTLVLAAEPEVEESAPEEAAAVEPAAAPLPAAEEAPAPSLPSTAEPDAVTESIEGKEEGFEVQDTAEPDAVTGPPVPEADNTEPTAPAPKVRKGRTAGQILKAKSGRKSAKAATSKTVKDKAAPVRSSRRKPPVDAAPTTEPAAALAPTPPEPATEPEPTPPAAPPDVTAPVEAAPAPGQAAPKRRGRPPRKKPTDADESAPTT